MTLEFLQHHAWLPRPRRIVLTRYSYRAESTGPNARDRSPALTVDKSVVPGGLSGQRITHVQARPFEAAGIDHAPFDRKGEFCLNPGGPAADR
jgi:hypothetical protein